MNCVFYGGGPIPPRGVDNMFYRLADYMTEMGFTWHPNLKMISDCEQVKDMNNFNTCIH